MCCVAEKLLNFFRFGAEKSAARIEFRFNLFGDLFCSAAICNVAPRRGCRLISSGALSLK